MPGDQPFGRKRKKEKEMSALKLWNELY